MSFNLTTQQECLDMAGADVSSTLSGSSILARWCDQSESTFLAKTKIASGSTILSDKNGMVSETIAAMVGMKAINYDISGYYSELAAQTQMDVLRDLFTGNMEALRDENVKKFVTGA